MFFVTVCLLIIAAWLFFNAMNEKRWVEAHQHDDTVAEDEGFLPSFSAVTRAMPGGGKVSIDQENSFFARSVARVKTRTAGISDRFERAAEAARVEPGTDAPRSAADEDNFFGRSVQWVKGSTGNWSSSLDDRLRQEREREERSPPLTEENSFFARASASIGARDNAYGDRLAARYKEKVAPEGSTRPISEEPGPLNRAVARVSDKLEVVEKRIDGQMAAARDSATGESGLRGDNDLFSRIAVRIGDRNDAREALRRDAADSVDNEESYQQHPTLNRLGEDTDIVSRMAAKVGRKMGSMERGLDRKVAELKAREESPDGRAADGVLASVAGKLSEGVKRLDDRLDRKMESAGQEREPSPASDKDDFITRVSAKVGQRINDLDDTIVARSREASDSVDEMIVDTSRKVGAKVDEPVEGVLKKGGGD